MKRIACIFVLGLSALAAWAAKIDVGSEAQIEEGKKLYNQKCAQCHGYEGDAQAVGRLVFRPVPRDFTIGTYKIRTTPAGELPATQDIFKMIREGMPYTGMPAWPQFTDEQIYNLVYYIKSFQSDFADPDYAADPIQIPNPPEFSRESAKLGKKVFEDNNCMDCHGLSGRGDGPSAPTLKDDYGFPIRPADLTKGWTFRGGGDREDIYRTVMNGLDGTPMPSFVDGLPDEKTRWALVDYVYSLSEREPNYSNALTAMGSPNAFPEKLDLEFFEKFPKAHFPIVGQIMEPGRAFFPANVSVELKAVHNESELAVLVSWNDISPNTEGKNSPMLKVPPFDFENEEVLKYKDDGGKEFSDAVALQFPSQAPAGHAIPYFLWGDKKMGVDLYHVDLGQNKNSLFSAKGSARLEAKEANFKYQSLYKGGQWHVIYRLPKEMSNGYKMLEGEFVPLEVFLWDGLAEERGIKTGLSMWKSLYLKPLEQKSAFWPAVKIALMVLVLELILIFWVRLKVRKKT